jgi:hypothetical protein
LEKAIRVSLPRRLAAHDQQIAGAAGKIHQYPARRVSLYMWLD